MDKDIFTFCNEHLKDIGVIIYANAFKHLYEDGGSLSRACIVNISVNPLGIEKRRHEKITGSTLEQHRKRRTLEHDACYSDGHNVDDSIGRIDTNTHMNEARMGCTNGASTVSDDSNDMPFTSSKVEYVEAKVLKEDTECNDSVVEEATIKMESDEECRV